MEHNQEIAKEFKDAHFNNRGDFARTSKRIHLLLEMLGYNTEFCDITNVDIQNDNATDVIRFKFVHHTERTSYTVPYWKVTFVYDGDSKPEKS